ncbi:hypothetical protein LPW36_05390 [Jinshanibacter sp. LJY008]|uniref:Uncharacterized protein n=1 Tax=Limnobaculum eriocheiris TaxID=2897391 RepID=A0A9X1MV04_9GAMM|nr:hypothetical protein [Limnobaculum eriocheiris]MCD1125454.1 hypothetical protein [Limnobaculum eriocheiris]
MVRAKRNNMMIALIVIVVVGFIFKSEKPTTSDKSSPHTTATALLSRPNHFSTA